MTNKRFAWGALLLLFLPFMGCGSNEPSAKESADMQKAIQGKGVGEMPADVRKQMDEAMKKNGAAGAKQAPTP